jgi:hypothetical protein
MQIGAVRKQVLINEVDKFSGSRSAPRDLRYRSWHSVQLLTHARTPSGRGAIGEDPPHFRMQVG